VSEEDLTQRLGISRTPAREALKELEGQGLVQVSAVTGRRVIAQFDTDDVYETYTIRSALEELAASRAAARVTPDLVERLTSLQDEMEASPIIRDTPRRRDFEIDFDLHHEICAAAALPRLNLVLRPLWAQTHSLLRGVFTAGIYGDAAEDAAAYRDHRAIIAAIASGDPEQAEAAMRNHLRGRRDALISALRAHTGPGSAG
jgi:DNA-binding GntR family transcriptional regulator